MVRLITVIGHGTNLLPHFIKHYRRYVDEINIAIYETEMYPTIESEVSEIIKDYGNVKIVKIIKDRVFDWEKITGLYNFIKMKHPNDWWVVADIDEFQLYPDDDINKVLYDCDENGWEIVRGGFIDRIGCGGEFVEIKDNISIWEQFPNAGFFRYPMSKACPNKICLVKGKIPVSSGQHYAILDGETTWKWRGWNHPLIAPVYDYSVQVHHFKWDSTAIERIQAVADVKEEYAYSLEYFRMYNEIKKNRLKINLDIQDFMFELDLIYPEFSRYKKWNKLMNKIISI